MSGEFPEDLDPNLIITGIEFEPYSSSIVNTLIDSNYFENMSSGIFYINMTNPDKAHNFRSEIDLRETCF